MKNRLILCLLICGLLLYYGVPQLSLHAGGAEGLFAGAWLLFALLAVSGNMIGLLYRSSSATSGGHAARNTQKKRKVRQYQ